MFEWKFELADFEGESELDNLTDDYIKLLLSTLLDMIVLTTDEEEVDITGFRYIQDREDKSKTKMIFDI